MVITAIDIKMPGIAYPEIERFEIIFKKLFFKSLFPKLHKKANESKIEEVVRIRKSEFKFKANKSKLLKYLECTIDQ